MNKELWDKLKTNSLTDKEALDLYNSGAGVPLEPTPDMYQSFNCAGEVRRRPVIDQGMKWSRTLTEEERKALYEGSGPIYDRLVEELNNRYKVT